MGNLPQHTVRGTSVDISGIVRGRSESRVTIHDSVPLDQGPKPGAAGLMGLLGLARWRDEVDGVVLGAVKQVTWGDEAALDGAFGPAWCHYARAVSDVWLRVTPPGLAVKAAAMYGLAWLLRAEGADTLAVEMARGALKCLNGPLRNGLVREWWEGFGLRPGALGEALKRMRANTARGE